MDDCCRLVLPYNAVHSIQQTKQIPNDPPRMGAKSTTTSNHPSTVFAVNTLIVLYTHKRRNIFCCFVDYSKAFNSISRTKLWHKLLESNISGKIFILVHNMYKTAKSCVTSDGQIADTFPCLVGVRQGENVSPLLLSIYLGDLQLFLQDAHTGLTVVNKMIKDRLDESLLK